ncbi:hypothetical protein BH09MYX1_BH09MYX1_19770 [soil metagenome]
MNRRLFVTLGFLALASCSAADASAPVVDDATFPATAAKDASGNYTVSGNVTAHGSAAITLLTIHVVPQGAVQLTDATITVSGPVSPYPVALKVPGQVPAGTWNYEITATDQNGARSAALQKSIVLQ